MMARDVSKDVIVAVDGKFFTGPWDRMKITVAQYSLSQKNISIFQLFTIRVLYRTGHQAWLTEHDCSEHCRNVWKVLAFQDYLQ